MDLKFRKAGLPEESEIVICEVTKVYYNSVFVNIIEYDTSGMIHISEISPGRIRNINDYVKVGKVIICKVLRVNREKRQVDLSLRRVSEGIRREKAEEIKQEQKAEKIVELVAQSLKMDKNKMYDIVSEKVFEKYGGLHPAFEDVLNDKKLISKLGIEEKIAKPLTELILQRIRPPVFKIIGLLSLKTYDDDGVEKIKKTLIKVMKDNDVIIKYSGAGNYRIELEGNDFKSTEKNMEKVVKDIKKSFKGTIEFKIESKVKT